ncbi:oxooacyl-coA reductase let-767 [Seminavis robusta]|uniref:Oxooacyl-coA reductase let-767 n=1 Tax=Seminavis robusta TaxID=568900 RepID=A0A9N8HLI6_9STRA|nr:oxooacyl-coA reductase let-767 [Seminavis robusta]|eukprot:Sro686_g187090.1 oxooacyl-coA reductase let-767 (329) ;mRNA; r:27854-29062
MESMMSFASDLKSVSPLTSGCALIGGVVVLLFIKKVAISAYKTFLRPAIDFTKLGKWAVVTGATDGIGKAYAFELAKRGVNVVIISRTESKLEAVKKEIDDKKYGVEVKYVVCDYGKFDTKARDMIAKELEGLEIGVLINNVGASYRYPRYFHELPKEEIQHLLTMNVDSTVWMTEMVLKGMVERKKGAIVNLSSAAARYTQPLLAEYGACKSFIEKFSCSLNAEYSGKGITCQCQAPFFVATKLAKMRKSWSVPTPEEYCAQGIKWIGYPDDIVSPFWIHATAGWVLLTIPQALTTAHFTQVLGGLRKRGIAKDANGGVSPQKTKKN